MRYILIFLLCFSCSFSNAKELKPKSYSKVIEEAKTNIREQIGNIYYLKIEPKYSIENNSCSVSLNLSIMIDAETLNKLGSDEVEKIFVHSFDLAMRDYDCWALFFFEVKKVELNYEIIPIGKQKTKKFTTRDVA